MNAHVRPKSVKYVSNFDCSKQAMTHYGINQRYIDLSTWLSSISLK